MSDETTPDEHMGEHPSKKGYTAPKGRPTRARDDVDDQRRAFGPVAQWITLALAIVVAVVVVIMLTDGGDFNPFDDDNGAPAVSMTPIEPVGR